MFVNIETHSRAVPRRWAWPAERTAARDTCGRDDTLNLPWSEVTGRARLAREPRGSALAWQTRFLHEVDRDLAAAWWRGFKTHYLVETPLGAGFREWPPGRERGADADSGPIVAGVGAAATALAIAAARVMNDQPLAARLQATASVVRRTARTDPLLTRAAGTILASAILYLGEHAAPDHAEVK